MQIVVLLPMLVCIVMLFRWPLPKVFLNIFLPAFIFIPSYYYWKVATLPPINLAAAVLLPLGIGVLIKLLPRWRFTTMDIWMAAYLVSTYVADKHSKHDTAAVFDLFNAVVEGFVPYMLGKLLIEQSNIRIQTARRLVALMAICCIVSQYEYRMAENPFTILWHRFFPDEAFAWKTQIRWGFGRVSGPWGQSELAGIIIIFTLMMAIWVGYAHPWREKFAAFPHHPFLKRTLLFGLLAFFLFSTQARGPWLGCIIALPIALVGKSRHILRNSILLACILVPVGAGAYTFAKLYTSGSAASNEQQTAQYRSQLIDNYVPVARLGGAWGWGQDFPRVEGQESIDNEYLFVWLIQGWVGAVAFCLLAGESVLRTILAAIHAPTPQDRFFAFTFLGALVGMLLTITTVFLGNQTYQLFFLLAGWSQVMNTAPRHAAPQHVAPQHEKQLTFANVLT